MIFRRLFAVALLLFAAAAPAWAQFSQQATWAGTGAGTANAQTISVANVSAYADLLGVPVRYVPAASNTTAATLNVSSLGSSPEIRKPNGGGLVALTGGEIITGQPTEVVYNGTYFVLMSPLSLPVGVGNVQTSAFGYNAPPNLQINATVSANQLTIALKGANGTDASASNPVPVAFRNATIALGSPTWVNVTGALSFTIASSNTMGCLSGVMCRLWIVAFNNAGTVQLCAFNALSGSSIAPIDESSLQSSAVGTSGGSSAQIFYCNASSVTSVAVRILGYVEIQEVTAGTWATGPTLVQLFGPGVRKPGDVVQERNLFDGTVTVCGSTTFTTLTPVTVNVTPTSAANVLKIKADLNGGAGGAGLAQAQISRGLGPSLIGTMGYAGSSSGSLQFNMPVTAYDQPNSTAQQTYAVFCKTTTSTWTINQGGSSSIVVQEIMSELKPANDDLPLSMVG